ncbi:Histone-lysine N-methyltransferase ASHR3 [Euphorbia peplus]|nr:Histone-lysine N-methyltransferase ASHR3 [Euphorbia peplus]
MPDLGNLSVALTCIKTLDSDTQLDSGSLESAAVKTLVVKDSNWEGAAEKSIRVFRRNHHRGVSKKGPNGKSLDDYVRAWVQTKMDAGLPNSRCFLPFLVAAKKSVECLVCHSFIYPDEGISCSVRTCERVYHLVCAKKHFHVSSTRKFKCPQHACFRCSQKFDWRCVRCTIASHYKCSPWPNKVIHFIDQPRRAVCWRHETNWRLDKKHMDRTSDIEEVFGRLPIPYIDEEFKIDLTWKDLMVNKLEPPPYVHIRRNVYLVKKKRGGGDIDVGCTNCSSTCCEDCMCRVQCISCSRACHCPDSCTNRPFRREKKIKIVKTQLCGWGVEAVEPINKGDFIIEYTGEVINDALCEQRLWDMKYKGVKNFYMCEIGKDFTIDATFKGNASRFLNHSCDPNCIMEKWQVEGETRVGLFAYRSITVGEPLTYDYRFVQFGSEVKCQCGASNCHGYLGNKRKIVKLLNICWGTKRRRASTPKRRRLSTPCLAVVS